MADIVVRHGDDVEIRDLKSGRTLNDAGEVSEAYRIQLLLYGVMYEDSFGVWPTRLVIDPLARNPIEVDADRREAIRYRRAVSDAMDAFDAAVTTGTTESLANPSPDTCRFCPHVSRCRPFWSAANKGWSGVPRALAGTVIGVVPGAATVAVSAGTIDYGSWTIGGIGLIDVAVDDFVEVIGFEWRSDRRIAIGEGTTWRLVSRPAEKSGLPR